MRPRRPHSDHRLRRHFDRRRRGEYMLAGASAVQVGTATFVQPAAMTPTSSMASKFCLHRDIPRVSDLTGGVVIEEADEPDLAWLNPPT
jgi:dihydroorotate dehydrogenase (NAD+) catalytic subunit